MATRNSVLTKITAINDKGNNSAAEVRDVLTELLDYTENKPGLEPFHIFSSNAIISNKKEAKLFFSIKGMIGQTANMTILVKPFPDPISDRKTFTFIIPFDQDQGMFTIEKFNLLAGVSGNGIIPVLDDGNYFIYQIPIVGNIEATNGQLVIGLSKNFDGFKNSLALSVPNVRTGFISTSVSMHSQKFDEPADDKIGENAGTKGKNSKSSTTDSSFVKELFGFKF